MMDMWWMMCLIAAGLRGRLMFPFLSFSEDVTFSFFEMWRIGDGLYYCTLMERYPHRKYKSLHKDRSHSIFLLLLYCKMLEV